jgi:hypothetical protein
LPVFPLLLVPVLKKSAPLTPVSPEFKLRITTAPLDEAVPSPDMMRTAPPVRTVLRPPLIWTWPPVPLVPLPTLTTMAPARPNVATPVPRYMAPLLLDWAVPVLKKSAPLAPFAPPFVDRIFTSPLVVAVPSPLTRLSRPPVRTVLRPAKI